MTKPRFIPAILLILAAAGCQDLRRIPLFNPEARPLNRVASAKEVITECNLRLATYVDRGWISQATVDKTFGPRLDEAARLARDAEALLRAGDPAGQPKVDALYDLLLNLRNQLAAIERANK